MQTPIAARYKLVCRAPHIPSAGAHTSQSTTHEHRRIMFPSENRPEGMNRVKPEASSRRSSLQQLATRSHAAWVVSPLPPSLCLCVSLSAMPNARGRGTRGHRPAQEEIVRHPPEYTQERPGRETRQRDQAERQRDSAAVPPCRRPTVIQCHKETVPRCCSQEQIC